MEPNTVVNPAFSRPPVNRTEGPLVSQLEHMRTQARESQERADAEWRNELNAQRADAERLGDKMQRILDAFYNGEISAGMLASNPALQLWVQQALQWENRLMTTISNLLKEAHDTRKEILRNLRG